MILVDEATRIFRAGLAAADPGPAVTLALQKAPVQAASGGALWVVAVGKAAVPMARAAMDLIPDRAGVLIVTNPENAEDVPEARLHVSSHPVPDAAGLAASQAVAELAAGLAEGDHLLVLISGGGSALLPAPVEGVSLEDKIAVNKALLASGAPIEEMNLVRQQLSRLKGGGLARLAAPAQVTALILSDVVGDDLRAVASGPTVAPMGTKAAARALLEAYGLWGDLPSAVRGHLSQLEEPVLDLPPVDNRLIGSNTGSLAAMADAAPQAVAASAPLVGLAEDAALEIVAKGQGSWLWGGETTVLVTGQGKGGRNQHLALKVALLAEAKGWTGDWVFLSGGTDGRDGPTEAAGAIVGPSTLSKMRAAGIDPVQALADNDSNPALAAAGALLVTGGTGTNVADLQVLIRS